MDVIEFKDDKSARVARLETCSQFSTSSGCCRSLKEGLTVNEFEILRSKRCQPEDVVDGDDAVRPRRPRVMDDRAVALNPHPAAVLGEEAVVLGTRLAFLQD